MMSNAGWPRHGGQASCRKGGGKAWSEVFVEGLPCWPSSCETSKGLVCLRCRKPNSGSGNLQQSEDFLQSVKYERKRSTPMWSLSLGVFLKENKETGHHHLVTFLWYFLTVVSGVRMSLVYDSLAIPSGIYEFIMPWRNNLSLYVEDDIYKSNSHL